MVVPIIVATHITIVPALSFPCFTLSHGRTIFTFGSQLSLCVTAEQSVIAL
jgi:hypothetical protein